MPQVQITDLPNALPLTGAESVPIVQGGVTVQTTTGAISGAGALNYPFLTAGSTVGLTQARQLAVGTSLSLTDGGPGSTLQVNLTGAVLSLASSPSGFQVKIGPNTLTGRSIAVGGGLTVANADGVFGDPTIGLNTNLQNLAALSGTGLVTVNGSSFSQTSILGTSNQITVANGNASAGSPTVGIASDAVLPGTGSVVLPQGTTAQRAASTYGALRYNTDTQSLEAYTQSTGWGAIVSGTGVTTFSAGSTGLTPSTATTGGIVLGGVLNPASGGTGVNNGLNTITLGGVVSTGGDFSTSGAYAVTLTATNTTSLTLPTTGTLATLAGSETLTNKTISGANNTLTNIGNSSLSNSSVTYNGVTVALGASGTITSNTPNALTFNNGGSGDASGTTFDGSVARTISYNTVGASPLAGSTSLTTLGTITTGVWNGTPIGNSYLANSTVTIGTTSIALGGSSLTLGGLTSVAVTQDPVSALQLATKQYVDAVAEGLHVHAACAAATTGTLASITGGTVTYNNGTAGVGATLTLSVALTTLDGYSLQNGDRILVKNEATQANNGIYTWATGGTVLTRATDFDTTTEVASGDFTFVTNGTLYANTGWVQTNPVTAIGTSPIVFIQFSGAGTYTAGTGLTLTGSQFSLTVPVTAALGGTGQTSYTTGDLLYATGATALSKLGIGSSGNFLSSTGSAPQWSAPAALTKTDDTNVTLTLGGSASTALLNAASLTLGWTGQLSLTRGGTNASLTASAGSVAYSTASALALNTAGNSGDWLRSAGTSAPAWTSPAALTKTDDTNVTLTLGGSASTALLNAASLTLGWTGQLAVSRGGTGASTFTANGVLYGNTTSAIQATAAGTTGQVLVGNTGAAPSWTAASGISVGTATNLAGGTAGAIPYQTGAGATTFLSLGTTNYVLTAGASAPQYVAQSTLSVGSATNATNTAITADSTNATNYLTFVSATTGNLPQLVNSSITCNPSTGKITAGIAGGAF